MDVIGHDAVGVQCVMEVGDPANFIRHDLRDVFLPEPIVSMLSAVEPFIVMPKVFFLDSVAFFCGFGGLQFVFTLSFQLGNKRGGERIYEIEGDEERNVLRVDVR